MTTTLTRCRHPFGTRETASRSTDCGVHVNARFRPSITVAESRVQSASLDAVSALTVRAPQVGHDGQRRRRSSGGAWAGKDRVIDTDAAQPATIVQVVFEDGRRARAKDRRATVDTHEQMLSSSVNADVGDSKVITHCRRRFNLLRLFILHGKAGSKSSVSLQPKALSISERDLMIPNGWLRAWMKAGRAVETINKRPDPQRSSRASRRAP